MQCDTTHLKALDPKNIYPTLKSVKNKSTRTKGNFNQREEVNHKQKKKKSRRPETESSTNTSMVKTICFTANINYNSGGILSLSVSSRMTG